MVKRWRGHGSLTANCATDIGINSIHARSMQPFACCRKFKIPFVVKSENAACRLVDGWSDRFAKSESTLQPRARWTSCRMLTASGSQPRQDSNLQPDRYERRDKGRV